MVSVNFQKYEKVYQTGGTQKAQTAPFPVQNEEGKTTTTPPSFRAQGYTSAVSIRTELTTSDEKKKYNELVEVLD